MKHTYATSLLLNKKLTVEVGSLVSSAGLLDVKLGKGEHVGTVLTVEQVNNSGVDQVRKCTPGIVTSARIPFLATSELRLPEKTSR